MYLEEKVYHYERSLPAAGSETPYKQADPVEAPTLKSLISNYLCMGTNSPCVVGTCDVMCGYGRRYGWRI